MKTRFVQVTSAFGEARTADGAKETLILKSRTAALTRRRESAEKKSHKNVFFSHFYLNWWFVFGLCRIM